MLTSIFGNGVASSGTVTSTGTPFQSMYSPAKGAHAVRDSLLKSLQRHKANQYAVFATSDQYSPQKVAHQFDDALVVRSSFVISKNNRLYGHTASAVDEIGNVSERNESRMPDCNSNVSCLLTEESYLTKD